MKQVSGVSVQDILEDDALEEVAKTGVTIPDIRNDRTQQNIVSLALYRQGIFLEVLDHMKRTPKRRKYLWSYALSNYSYYPHPSSSGEGTEHNYDHIYRSWIAVIDLLGTLCPVEEEDITYTEDQLSNILLMVTDRVGRVECSKLLATMIVVRDTYLKSQRYLAREQVDTVEWVENRLDDVLPLLPELMVRGDASMETIQMLLNSETPALRGGTL